MLLKFSLGLYILLQVFNVIYHSFLLIAFATL